MNLHPTWNDKSKIGAAYGKKRQANPKRSLFSHNAGASRGDSIAICEKCSCSLLTRDLNAHWRECVSAESK